MNDILKRYLIICNYNAVKYRSDCSERTACFICGSEGSRTRFVILLPPIICHLQAFPQLVSYLFFSRSTENYHGILVLLGEYMDSGNWAIKKTKNNTFSPSHLVLWALIFYHINIMNISVFKGSWIFTFDELMLPAFGTHSLVDIPQKSRRWYWIWFFSFIYHHWSYSLAQRRWLYFAH